MFFAQSLFLNTLADLQLHLNYYQYASQEDDRSLVSGLVGVCPEASRHAHVRLLYDGPIEGEHRRESIEAFDGARQYCRDRQLSVLSQ